MGHNARIRLSENLKDRNKFVTDSEDIATFDGDTSVATNDNGSLDILIPPIKEVNLPLVGSALRNGITTALVEHIPNRKKLRTENPSWRERLELAHRKSVQQDSSELDSSAQSSDESLFSGWSGIHSQDDGNGNVFPITEKSQPSETEPDSSRNTDSSTSSAKAHLKSTEIESDTKQRAMQFKLWAREQSGFGTSISNIPALLIPSPKKPETGPSLKRENSEDRTQALQSVTLQRV